MHGVHAPENSERMYANICYRPLKTCRAPDPARKESHARLRAAATSSLSSTVQQTSTNSMLHLNVQAAKLQLAPATGRKAGSAARGMSVHTPPSTSVSPHRKFVHCCFSPAETVSDNSRYSRLKQRRRVPTIGPTETADQLVIR
jgi:hypothetical protein